MNTTYPTCGSLALSRQETRLQLVFASKSPRRASILDEATIYLFGDDAATRAACNGSAASAQDGACIRPLRSKDKAISMVIGVVATALLFVLSFV